MSIRQTPWIAAGILWIGSVIGAYWAGTLRASRVSEGGEPDRRAPTLLPEKQQGAEGSGARPERARAALPPASGDDLAAWARENGRLLRNGMHDPAGMLEALRRLAELPADQVEEALAAAARLPEGPERYQLLEGLLSRWAEFDPGAAIAFLQAHGGKYGLGLGNDAMGGIVAAWARQQPEEAWRWLAREEVGSAPDGLAVGAAAGLFRDMAARDLQGTFRRLGELQNLNVQAQALTGFIEGAAAASLFETALGLVEELPQQTQRIAASQRLLSEWAQASPKSAAAWYESQHPEDPFGNLRHELGAAWLTQDPQAAAEWWWEQTPPEQRGRDLEKVIGMWAQREPGAASQWLETFEPGPELDRAVASLVHSAARVEPQRALEWAGAITDAAQRQHALETTVLLWGGTDRDGALQYLRTSGNFTPDRRAALEATLLPPGAQPN